MKTMKFPKELGIKVNMKKVNMDVIKPWIAKRVTELLGGLEDEVLIGLIYNELEQQVCCVTAALTSGVQMLIILAPRCPE